MIDYELKDIDAGDIDDLLAKVEASFDIKFREDELQYIRTFGQFSDHIANKIDQPNTGGCTSQQAFYKLRKAILTLHDHSLTIDTKYSLVSLFPIKNRRISIKKIEDHLGIQLNLLRAPHWITVTLSLLFLISLFGLAFHWKIALIGFTLSFVGIFLASKFGTVLDLQTVGQLTSKMACEHYLKCRRNPQTFNKAEIQTILTDLFSNDLALHKYKLTRQAQFG